MSEVPAPARLHLLSRELEQLCTRNLLDTIDESIYFKDLQSRFITFSRSFAALHDRQPEELGGLTDFDLFTEEHAMDAYADEQRIIASGASIVDKEERETWSNRGDSWVTTTKHPLRDRNGKIIGTFGVSRDITRMVHAEEEAVRNAAALALAHSDLSRVEAQLRTVLETSADGIALYDSQLRYQYLNAAARRTAVEPTADFLGRTDRELGRDDAFLAVWETGLRSVLASGVGCAVDFSLGRGRQLRWFASHLAPLGGPDTSDGGPLLGVVASTHEVTELKHAQDKLAHQAVHDPLTGVANRVLLIDRLTQALLRMERQPGKIALLFVDVDHFKSVNDTYGHDAGDRLLIEVAERLTAIARRLDTVARFGGDEFVILCDKLQTGADVRVVAERVVRALAVPFVDNDTEFNITASVGVVMASDPYAGAEDTLRDADAAMYQAKERGRNQYQFFDASLRERATAKRAIETELVVAIRDEQFRLDYQPVFALSDQHIIGFEALIRWDHPERGTVPPAEFIDIAENRGLIVPIGTWALNEACRQLVEWTPLRKGTGAPLTMAVNVSGRQLRANDFVDEVTSALGRHGLAPGQLCLEITETALIEETADARDALEELAGLGVHIALDDFGTGYSSLAHLRQFPVDILKIDRSFVDRLETSDRDRQIVAAVTSMAHVLGMTVVGEGIETFGQLRELTDLGCDDGQGYLLARPMRPEAVALLL